MKTLSVLATAMLITNIGYAQGQPKAKNGQQATKVERSKTAAPIHKATGPTGFGPIKIGMTKEAIEALQEPDGIYLAGLLTPAESKTPLPDGVTQYKSSVRTPLDTVPIDVSFRFADGKLISANFTISESAADVMRKQIGEKYGQGKIDDSRKEEQCVYRNGSNFKVTSGIVSEKWFEPVSTTEQVQTMVYLSVIDVCPSNLRYGSTGAFKFQSLSISKEPITSPEKSANLF